MPFVTVNGLRIRYRETGAERPGIPLLFIHGAAGSSVTWLGVMRRLGRTRRCLAPDLPGHGQSAPLPGGPVVVTIEAYRDFAGAFAAALGLGRVMLVGHSMGGAVVQEAALAWPERAAGLVLIATSARLPVAPAIFQAIDQHFAAFPELMAQTGFSTHTPRDMALRLARAGLHAPQAIVHADFDACNRWDARERVAAVQAPTVVIVGEEDLLTPPKWARKLTEQVKGARLVTVPRAGHMVHLEAPDEAVRVIAAMAAGVG